MRHLLMTVAALMHYFGRPVQQELSGVQVQQLSQQWIHTSVSVVAAIQRHLRYDCIHIVNTQLSGTMGLKMTLQFLKLLSLQGTHVAISHPDDIERMNICNHNLALYVVLFADGSAGSNMQEFAKGHLSEGMWLLFMNATIQDAFRDVNVPFNSFVVAATRDKHGEVLLEEVYRVAPHLPLVTRRVGTWHDSAGGLSWTSQGVHSRTSHLRGLTIRAASSHNPPFTIMEIRDNRTKLVGGYIGEVWNTLEKRLQFTTEWFTADNMTSVDGREMLQMVSGKQIDMVVTDTTITSSKADIVDFTIPLLTYRFSVFLRELDKEDLDWTTYLKPFSSGLWLTVSGAILLLAIFLSAMHRLGHTYGNENEDDVEALFGFYDAFFYIFTAFCQQGGNLAPKATSCRVVYWLSSITALVLLAAYSGVLVSFIAIKNETLPFLDLKELLHSGEYGFGVMDGSTELTFFSGAKPNTFLQKIYTELIMKDSSNIPKTDEEGFQRVCDKRYAYMAPIEYALSTLKTAKCVVVALPRQYFHASLAIALSNDSSYRDLINKNLQSMIDNGVLHKLREDAWKFNTISSQPKWVSVDMKHVVPILCVLVFGTTTAIILLLLEVKNLPLRKKLPFSPYIKHFTQGKRNS